MSCWRHAVLALTGGLVLLGACQARPDEPLVRARPVPLQEDAPNRDRLGELRFEAGFLLTSDDPRFGGLSGLWLAPDGREIMMVSDQGTLWRATLEHAGDRLTGIGGWAPVEPGRAPGDANGRLDAEALADDGRGIVIADEGRQRLRRLALDDLSAPAQPLPAPARLARAGNTGIEALAALPDGALLALSEGVLDGQGQVAAWRIDGDRIEPLSYRTIDGFVPTGADRLDDTVYVVERRVSLLSGFTARVVALDAEQVRPGATLSGRELARLGRPAISDNFEGIAARRAADGRTLLYLISDDNFQPLQQTLLLQFSLAGP
jgi:hypothetical protein